MLIEFQAAGEEALMVVGTIVRPAYMDLADLACAVFKLGKTTFITAQLKEATLENWELALTLLS